MSLSKTFLLSLFFTLPVMSMDLETLAAGTHMPARAGGTSAQNTPPTVREPEIITAGTLLVPARASQTARPARQATLSAQNAALIVAAITVPVVGSLLWEQIKILAPQL